MITDKQGKEWLFQRLYDAGWRYIVADNYDNIYLTNEKPSMFDDVDEIHGMVYVILFDSCYG